VIALAAAAKPWPLTNASYVLLFAFGLLHLFGARWLYSSVPYDARARALFGSDITHAFGFRRNHYDRVVHLAFGLLLMRPFRELAERAMGLPGRRAVSVAWLAIAAASAAYELAEWIVAVVCAPEDAEAYNGQQGDARDAHKDMALALLGGSPAGSESECSSAPALRAPGTAA
jgi:putative membrane protein